MTALQIARLPTFEGGVHVGKRGVHLTPPFIKDVIKTRIGLTLCHHLYLPGKKTIIQLKQARALTRESNAMNKFGIRLCMISNCPHIKCRASFPVKALSISQPCLFSPPLSQVFGCFVPTITGLRRTITSQPSFISNPSMPLKSIRGSRRGS